MDAHVETDSLPRMIVSVAQHLERHALRTLREDRNLRLTPAQAERLEALERATDQPAARFAERPSFSARLDARLPVRVPVLLRAADGSPVDGLLLDVSRGGVFVATALAQVRGERLSLTLRDEGAAREWHFACEVAWARPHGERGMGLRFLGVPLLARLGVSAPSARPARLPVAA